MEDRRDSMDSPYPYATNPYQPVAIKFSGKRSTRSTPNVFSPGVRYAPEPYADASAPVESDAPYLGVQPENTPPAYLGDHELPPIFLRQTMTQPSPSMASGAWSTAQHGGGSSFGDVNGVPDYLHRDAPRTGRPTMQERNAYVTHQPKHGAPQSFVPKSSYNAWVEMGWENGQPFDQTLVMHRVRPEQDGAPYDPIQATGQYQASAPMYAPEPSYDPMQATGQYQASAPMYAPEPSYDPMQATGQYQASAPMYAPEPSYDPMQATGRYQASAPMYAPEPSYDPMQATGQYQASAPEQPDEYATYDALGRLTQRFVPQENEPWEEAKPSADERLRYDASDANAPVAQPAGRGAVRPWRFVLMVSCGLALLFCAIEIGKIVTSLWANERDVKENRTGYYQTNGVTLDNAAARVELLPPGETYTVTETPAPVVNATPAPRISINDPLIAVMGRPKETETIDPALPTPPVRTKLDAYPDNALRYTDPTFETLLKENPDVIGRVSIPDVMDEVIVGRNNIYYLTHNARGSTDSAGAVFMDEKCSIASPPENLLLRGKTNTEGKLFQGLTLYGTGGADFVRAHKKIHLTTLYEDAYYDVFAVIRIDGTTSDKVSDYTETLCFASDEQMLAYVDNLKRHSMYNFDLDVSASDRLLTLATLSEGATAVNWVIVARISR